MMTGCATPSYRTAEGMIWNTSYHITYNAGTDLTDSILHTLSEVEQSVSAFKSTSVVSRINNNESTQTDQRFRTVYESCVRINADTQRAFDPTLAPLINLYGFGWQDSIPTVVNTDSVLQYVGIEKTRLQKGELIKQYPQTQFNFSAIAKGYGADCVADMFHSQGVSDYLIEIGGEIRASGHNMQGEPWHISVDKPIYSMDEEIHDSQVVISTTDCGLATSGNYRNYKEAPDGTRSGHTIDRESGKPAQTDILSATVIVPYNAKQLPYPCMEADAYATAFMALGSERALPIARRHKMALMFVMSDGSVVTTPEFDILIRR